MVLIATDRLGVGDDELGKKLIISFIKTVKEMGDELAEPYHDSRQRAYRGSSRRGRRLNYRALFGEDYSPSEEESESDSEAEEEGNYEKLSPTSKRKAHR